MDLSEEIRLGYIGLIGCSGAEEGRGSVNLSGEIRLVCVGSIWCSGAEEVRVPWTHQGSNRFRKGVEVFRQG